MPKINYPLLLIPKEPVDLQVIFLIGCLCTSHPGIFASTQIRVKRNEI